MKGFIGDFSEDKRKITTRKATNTSKCSWRNPNLTA